MALLLATHQILMLFETAVIFTGSPGMNMLLNGQMARLNLNGLAQGMCMVAVCC
jgi:hypothetical protein